MMETGITSAGVIGVGGGTCQKFPRVDEMQGRSKICHGEVGKEEAEESLQSSEH